MDGVEANVGNVQVLRHEQSLILALMPELTIRPSQTPDDYSHRRRPVQCSKRSSIYSILVLWNRLRRAWLDWIRARDLSVLCDIHTWHKQTILLLQMLTSSSDSWEQTLSHDTWDERG